jgi:transposase
MTSRLRAFLTTLTLATSREAASRLAGTWNMPVAPSTLLASVMRLPDPDLFPPEEIGLDEFAYRRGRVFGTILVDLEQHRVIDLLPDREPETVTAWLRQHPTVHVISRDRAEDFAKAIALGAPHAIQVLDRFHLVHNLVDLLPTIIGRCVAELRQATADTPSLPPLPIAEPSPPALALPDGPWKPIPTRSVRLRREVRHAERTERYQQMQTMRDTGMTSDQIGHALGLSPRTVRSQLQHYRADPQRRKRASAFDPYAAYIRHRWEAGCHNGHQRLPSKAIQAPCARCIAT